MPKRVERHGRRFLLLGAGSEAAAFATELPIATADSIEEPRESLDKFSSSDTTRLSVPALGFSLALGVCFSLSGRWYCSRFRFVPARASSKPSPMLLCFLASFPNRVKRRERCDAPVTQSPCTLAAKNLGLNPRRCQHRRVLYRISRWVSLKTHGKTFPETVQYLSARCCLSVNDSRRKRLLRVLRYPSLSRGCENAVVLPCKRTRRISDSDNFLKRPSRFRIEWLGAES